MTSRPEESTVDDVFAGTGPDPVPAGGILTVCYRDRAKAGQRVTVVAADGGDLTDTRSFEIPLRGNGSGNTLFIVPAAWTQIVLSTDDGSHTVGVALPP